MANQRVVLFLSSSSGIVPRIDLTVFSI